MSDAPPPSLPVPKQTPLYHALERARYTRQELIRDLEETTGRQVICYVGSPGAAISPVDVPGFVDLLHDVAPGRDVDLVLHTPGGDIDQAERIVKLCRKRVGSAGFRIVVPNSAKSAGTLMCLAADEIVMGSPSELGPIDPQITISDTRGEVYHRPAQSFLDGLRDIVEETQKAGQLSPVYFPLLDKLDPALIDFCKKALRRSQELATRFLERYMLRSDPDRHDKAVRIAGELNNVEHHLSHGAVIDAEQAQELGLVVRVLGDDDPVWQAFWRLNCEQGLALPTATSRLFEGRRVSLHATSGPGQ